MLYGIVLYKGGEIKIILVTSTQMRVALFQKQT